MPELGKYAVYVLGAYGGTLAIIAILVLASLRSSARARRELERLEQRHPRRRSAP